MPLVDKQVTQALARTLVLTTRKGFWAAPQCECFPHRIYAQPLLKGGGKWGSTRNPLNNLTAFIAGWRFIQRHQPALVLVASAVRTTKWLTLLKRAGRLPHTQLAAITQSYFTDADAQFLDKIIVYCRSEIDLHAPALQQKYHFIPLPADGDFAQVRVTAPDAGTYIFSGGGAGRDFASLIEAVRDLPVQLRIVTFSAATLGYAGPLPNNCTVSTTLPLPQFLTMMAGSQFVVAPLRAGVHPHGHTTIVQALRLGKAVITTRDASADDYVTDGGAGLLVAPGDIAGYRAAILQLYQEPAERQRYEAQARHKAADLTYEKFAERLAALCAEMVQP